MPVTLIVEDGSIVSGANSYVSRADATSYLEIDPRAGPVWAALDDSVKDQMLAFATRWIDENHIWFGRRVREDQPLDWPRCGMHDGEYPVASTLIPVQLKNATALAAVWLSAVDPEEASQQAGIKRFRNDTIEIEWQDNFSGQATVPAWMPTLLSAFAQRLGARGFKPIKKAN